MADDGVFKGWSGGGTFGFIAPDNGSPDVFVHKGDVKTPIRLRKGTRLVFRVEQTSRGPKARDVAIAEDVSPSSRSLVCPTAVLPPVPAAAAEDAKLMTEDVEELDTSAVTSEVLKEIGQWKREAKAEDNDRYFCHVSEVDEISRGTKYFVIGRKGSGKTAICEYFNKQRSFDLFAEKLSFKNFPFNELYQQKNDKYTPPNQFITIWKYLIYSTVCRLMLKNESVDATIRAKLGQLYEDETPLGRRVGRWVGREFGVNPKSETAS